MSGQLELRFGLATVKEGKHVDVYQFSNPSGFENRVVIVLRQGKLKSKHTTLVLEKGESAADHIEAFVKKFTFKHGVRDNVIDIDQSDPINVSRSEFMSELAFLRGSIPNNLYTFLDEKTSATPIGDVIEERKAAERKRLAEEAAIVKRKELEFYENNEMSGIF